MKNILVMLLVIMTSMSACNKKTKKMDSGAMTNKMVLSSLQNHNFNYKFYSSDANIDIITEQMSIGATGVIRADDKGALWIVAKKFGFEVGRAMVKNDTIKVIDRFRKRYAVQSVNKLKSLTSMENVLAYAQQYIVGNIVIPKTKNKKITIQDVNSIIDIDQGKKYQFVINNIDKKLSSMTVIDGDNKLKIEYLSYTTVDEKLVPNQYNIKAYNKENKKIELDIKLSKVTLNAIKGMPFSIPNNYKEFKL